ncbi:hypothetical protein [Pyruvatibacter mobilis]|jgi:hypothetical protein|uniref:hypothetical protein n=1 Tax=Pyruvatibacter mobilis TaxID=1712261 RepID=UPI000418F45C|nr:hypothetical protein [Pyruvatibacter mobilis]QJD75757.1 hypothetical protein HG718_10240 [Pyruvatibacter mobilis]GGD18284.1 hypothetical protein GCM10011587_23320 [Pyruvatibacter mobilis]
MSDEHQTELNAVTLTPEQKKKLRRRNIAVAISLFVLVGLFFAMTLVRLGGNVADRTY